MVKSYGWILRLTFLFVVGCTAPTVLPTTNTQTWEEISVGLEQRLYVDDTIGSLVVVRVDPTLYSFRSHYRPGEPLRVEGWGELLLGEVAFINSNFYDAANQIVGLLIADGVVYGQSYRNRGGMFAVLNGVPQIRSNIFTPYQGEPFEQAVQAFPMLVLEGQQAYTSQALDRNTRRTAIGQDSQGRILLIAATNATLLSLSNFLATSDMALMNALNLDGGGSTMMSITPEDYVLTSRDPVPAVLAIYPK